MTIQCHHDFITPHTIAVTMSVLDIDLEGLNPSINNINKTARSL